MLLSVQFDKNGEQVIELIYDYLNLSLLRIRFGDRITYVKNLLEKMLVTENLKETGGSLEGH